MSIHNLAIGRLAAQPELRHTDKGTPVTEFRVLSSRYDYKQRKEVIEAATFFCYGEDAERICSNAVKGQQIECTGHQETSHYEDRDGQKKTFVKNHLTHFTLGFKPRVQGQEGSQESRQQSDHGYGASQPQAGYGRREDAATQHPAPRREPPQLPPDDNWIDD